MMIVISREKALQLSGLVIMCIAVGVFWALSGPERDRAAQTASTTSAPAGTWLSATDMPDENVPVMAQQSVTPQGSPSGIIVDAPKVALFAEYRMELDRARSAQIELLQTVLRDQQISPTQREQLNAELMLIMRRDEAELQSETLLRAKGYTDAIVVITQSGANVVVPAVLTKQDVAIVGELTSRASGVAIERITIIDGAS